ncbi:MAG: response regulator, partial [Bacteriovoracaceae bacterium]
NELENEQKSEQDGGEKKGKVLLIDDEAGILELVSAYLKNEFNEILVAQNGSEGLAQFKANQDLDVVICDINMPGMEGVEVIKEIRQISDSIPFFFFTGFGSRKNMLEAAKHGAFDFIEKPDIQGLLKSVRAAVYDYNSGDKEKDMEEHLSEYKKLLSAKES